MTEDDLESKIHLLIEEYLENNDIKEAEQCIKDLNSPQCHSKIIEQAIVMTLEKNEKERDQISKLFCKLSPEIFPDQDFVKAFKLLVESVDDLEIDIPSASVMLGHFIGRAVVDNCISLSLVEKETKKEKVKESMMQVIHAK